MWLYAFSQKRGKKQKIFVDKNEKLGEIMNKKKLFFIFVLTAAIFTVACDSNSWQGDYDTSEHGDSLANLEGYTSVKGNLSIYSTRLSDLKSLVNLKSVSGDLIIGRNSSLVSLEGLNNLTEVGGTLYVGYVAFGSGVGGNDNLSNIEALHNVAKVGGLAVAGNPELTSLKGLGNLNSTMDLLWICRNFKLNSIKELIKITSVQNLLVMSTSLTNLNELGNITTVGEDLLISNNYYLTRLGLDGLRYVGNNFKISENNELCTDLAETLKDQVLAGNGIGGEIDIAGNMDCFEPKSYYESQDD